MSFVDELKYQIDNADEIKRSKEEKQIVVSAKELIKAIKQMAVHSPNTRLIKGYVYYERDIDYGFSIFDIKEDLPTCDIKKLNKKDKNNQHLFVLRDETKKSRLYKPVLCFESLQKATIFKDALNEQLAELGFTQICNTVQEIPDMWHITESHRGFFYNSRKHSLATEGLTYVVHLTIKW